MIRIFCLILTILGASIMGYTAIQYFRLVKSQEEVGYRTTGFSRVMRNISLATPFFFFFGYIIGGIDIFIREVEPIYYFVVTVFFIGALFIFMLVHNQRGMTNSLKEKNNELHQALGQIEKHNQELKVEIDRRVHEIMFQDKLLRVVNDAASILLMPSTEDFGEVLLKCMGMLAESVKVDRVYVWKNYIEDGTMYSSQIYEWSGGAAPQQGNELTMNVPLSEFAGGWKYKLSRGICVNGPVKSLSPEEQKYLFPQNIVSILVVPVFLEGEFWGFVGFDDCHRERYFSVEEEGILRSGSLLITNAVLRNEATLDLVQAREEALSSTRAKSDFLANISHEIRTPINAITGMAAIARSSDDMERIRNCLSKIDTASRQLLALINDVLDMSKIEANRVELAHEPFELVSAIYNIKSIIDVRAAEKQQSFVLTLSPDVPEIALGDDMRMSQILLNLLSNAVKFTPEYGEIYFTVNLAGKADGRIELEVTVRDTGIGMSREQQGRLFSKFEQADRGIARRFGGTGLGLVISKNLVEMMDGSIRVKSEEGKGSCFTVRFFLYEGTRDMLNKHTVLGSGTIPDFSGRKVLLVEDVEINREIVISLFENTKLNIDCAENGQIALDLFQADPEKYDLIFMDVQMPVMDGYTATRKLRDLDLPQAKVIPVIAMTANAFSDDVASCRKAGMNDHIAKPIDVNDLFRKTGKFLNIQNIV